MKAILTFIAGLIINCLVGVVCILFGIAVWGAASCEVVCPESDYDNKEDCNRNRADFIKDCVHQILSW